jgi:hypothetical protein
VGSYLAALALIPTIALLNWLLIVCTNYKVSKIDKGKWDQELKIEDLDTAAVLMNYD